MPKSPISKNVSLLHIFLFLHGVTVGVARDIGDGEGCECDVSILVRETRDACGRSMGKCNEQGVYVRSVFLTNRGYCTVLGCRVERLLWRCGACCGVSSAGISRHRKTESSGSLQVGFHKFHFPFNPVGEHP